MLTTSDFSQLLKARNTLIIDGGLATELESRGHDLSHPLWSGKILMDQPEAIRQLHVDYYLAGADVAITSSYQISEQGLREQLSLDDAQIQRLIVDSVGVAKQAREMAWQQGVSQERRLLIAGSVGPYGAYLADGSEYTGSYDLPPAAMKDFHRTRIQALIQGGVDLLALETMPNLQEIKALIELLAQEFPDAIAYLSCTMRDPAHICDGTSIEEVLAVVASSCQVVAFGVNCVTPDIVTSFVQAAGKITELPLLCYPNSGEIYDGHTKSWSGQENAASETKKTAWREWHQSGARLIGGCCRTVPADINALSAVLGER